MSSSAERNGLSASSRSPSNTATEDLHGAVDVAYPQPEQDRDDDVVGLGDDQPMERVPPLDPIADHRVHRARSVRQAVQEALHLRQVELEVAVGEGDQLATRIREPGLQRPP